jgi:hypothetical protein
MGTSKPNVDIYIPAILVSFVKIKELESIYHKKREGKLSTLLFNLIEKLQNGFIITPITEKFKDIKDEDEDEEGKKRNQPDEIIDYIIRKLDKELNVMIKIEEKDKEEEKEIKKKFFDSKNNSLIKKLFFGNSFYDVTCKNCKRCLTEKEEFTNKVIDLTSKRERRIDIKNFFETDKYEIKKEITCDKSKCKKKYEYTIKNNYFVDIKEESDFPDILIMHFKSKEKTIVNNDIDSIMKLEIKDISYNLICFIAKVDQKNDPDEQNNVFYLKNSIWYIYKTQKNIEMKVSIPINAIPLVAFYQKDNTIFNSYYTNIISLLNDKENTLELLDEHILNDDIYDNYYIVNKKWYSEILKLYENEENYNNKEYEINSKNLTNISKLNYIETLNLQEMFFERKRKFKEISSIETEKKDDIEYPINFMLIKEDILNYLLDNVKFKKDEYKKFLYEIKFGEKYAFIIDQKSNEEEKTIFVSIFSSINNSFQVVAILNYKSDNFEKEIKEYISNKGGLEYYYFKRNLDMHEKGKQIIKNSEGSEIGFLINIEDGNTHLNEAKIPK